MKPTQTPHSLRASLLLAAAITVTTSANAQVVNIDNQTLHYGTLLTDNFDTGSYGFSTFNNNIGTDQGGILATIPYRSSVGNSGDEWTLQHSNGGHSLVSSSGWWNNGAYFSPNRNFAADANTAGLPLEISAKMWVTDAWDANNWIGLGIGSGQGQLFYEGPYGVMVRQNFGVHDYRLVISDVAGTGSGFNGIANGARIELFIDNVSQGATSHTLATDAGFLTFRTLPSAWGTYAMGHVDNLRVATGPQTNPLATTTELNLVNNGSINFGDVTQTVTKLDGTVGSTVKLLNSSLTVDGSVDSSFAGVISGNGGSLVKNGTGTLTLSGANTYSGPTTVNAGILSVGNGTNSSSLNDSAAVTVGQATASGAKINLNFSGTDVVGSLTLDGTNAGTGFFDATSHPDYFTGTGQLYVAGGVIADGSGIWASSDNGYWEDAGNWASNTIASGIDSTATFNGALGTTVSLFNNLTIGNLAFSVEDYTLAGAALTLNASVTPAISVDSARTATISANLAGTGGMEKTGDGKLVLTGVKTYTGGTTVTAGTLELSGANGGNAIIRGTLEVQTGATVSMTNDDGTGLGWNDGNKVTALTINGGTVTSNGVMHVWNFPGGVNMTGGTLQSNGGISNANGPQLEWINANVTTEASADTATIGGRIRMRGDQGAAGITFTVADGDATTDLLVSAAITEAWTPGRSITKNGPGTMAFSGANSYTGTTTVNEGTLSLSNPVLNDNAPLVIGAGAEMDLNFIGSDTVGSLEIDGSGPLPAGTYDSSHATYGAYFTGTGSITIPGASSAWTSLTDGNWSDSANWAGSVSAIGYDSTATFNAATGVTVNVDSSRKIGNLAFDVSNYVLNGAGTLILDASGIPNIGVTSGRSATIGANLAGAAGLEKTGAGTLVFTGVKTYTGGTTVTAGTLELSGGNNGNSIIGGSLNIESGATVALTGGDGSGFGWNNPVTSINIDGGTLNAVNSSHIGFGGPAASLTLDNGGAVQGAWQWNGDGGLSFSSYGDSTNTIGGSLNLRADEGANHTFYVDNGATSADLQINANLSDQWPEYQLVPASGLIKTGTGTMVLNGTNTYDGNTIVSDGSLEVTASGSLHFRPTTNGATNSVSGSATGSLSFLGTVDLDLSAANATVGNAWNLFNLASFTGTAPSLAPTAVSSGLGSFAEVSPGTWELAVTGAKWVFTESNGNLAYVIAATDFDTWKTANGVTGGENDDDDNDGLSNSEEYAFGLAPNNSSSTNPIAVPLDDATGTFSYTRRQQSLTGLSYTIWYSTDLATWTQDSAAVQGTPILNSEVETVPVTLSAALLENSKLFIQVRSN